jgi:prolyl-tRNA editing enzyme YbaK/EbsC (Cys-tRNA(Pro) deacylase)
MPEHIAFDHDLGEKKRFFMIVVPGDRQFDKTKLREATGYTDVRFASEEEVSEITGGVIPGGVPPWGTLFGLEVHVDEHVFDNERIIFNAGDRRVSIAMRSEDYRSLIAPHISPLT